MHYDIVEGLARTLWVLQWAEHEEGAGRTYAGFEPEDIAPDTPEDAYTAANRLIRAIERTFIAEQMIDEEPTTIADLYQQAVESDDDRPYHFGVMLAHHHQQTGSRWEDDHERSWAFEVPPLRIELEEAAAEADPPELPRLRPPESEAHHTSRSKRVTRAIVPGPARVKPARDAAVRERQRVARNAAAREKRYVFRGRRRLPKAGVVPRPRGPGTSRSAGR